MALIQVLMLTGSIVRVPVPSGPERTLLLASTTVLAPSVSTPSVSVTPPEKVLVVFGAKVVLPETTRLPWPDLTRAPAPAKVPVR